MNNRKAYVIGRRDAEPGARAPYKYNELKSEMLVALPDILYSNPYIIWLLNSELSFLTMKYGHRFQFIEQDF